jgi:hypothetical protein
VALEARTNYLVPWYMQLHNTMVLCRSVGLDWVTTVSPTYAEQSELTYGGTFRELLSFVVRGQNIRELSMELILKLFDPAK